MLAASRPCAAAVVAAFAPASLRTSSMQSHSISISLKRVHQGVIPKSLIKNVSTHILIQFYNAIPVYTSHRLIIKREEVRILFEEDRVVPFQSRFNA